MSRTAKRWVLTGAAVVVVAIVVAAVVVLRGGTDSPNTASAASSEDSGDVVSRYLLAWSSGDDTAAGALTDDPAAAAAAFKAARTALAPTGFTATLKQVTGQTAAVHAKWTLGAGRVWNYDNNLELRHGDNGWRVHFTPAVIHPELRPGDRLAVRGASDGPAVSDRDGKPLMTWQADGPKAIDPAFAPLVLPGVGRLASDTGKGWAVVLIDSANKVTSLYSEGPARTKTLTTSLSSKAQTAAQAAVDAAGTPAMLVAVQPSTGDILAVAQNSRVTDGNALTGLYAPGSTFKIATAAAVLEAGVATADTVLPCPGTVQLGQRTIPNDDQFSLPPLPLHSAFAHSCNTTFAQLASQLPADALAKAASQFGLNADFDVPGMTTEAGKVVPSTGAADQVESAIGQGAVQASPFGLALMAATVCAGKAVTPELVRDYATSVTTGYQPPSGAVLGTLRSMMREVVTGGTATGLAGSGKVYGKTGTAQFGDGSHANGWFAGYRDDLAFSALLLGADSSKPAVSTSAAFLSRL
ncbi:penicillin-binding protein [Amycolatopsis acidiphila]|uniref:Penicillin-binding protein n=1 Tax=Amycolatopsis acidiphila TaxID=715473 RepID=A0A558ABF6_9PSEU|nr:penicillin-binding transpeptidase domain-containing protein [Amycolatopsis acidiphila]TVT21587.1 penicillin-binding protein [Amycolatopsis acidiphila]UIJ62163.1 penicillin-binding protein [Amycolatopsis acidiphila]GHG92200.1 penicillin-binding protein [Amycolatopsis acidiphila]